MRLNLKGNRPAVTDVDNASVLTHADQQVALHFFGGALAELLSEVLLR